MTRPDKLHLLLSLTGACIAAQAWYGPASDLAEALWSDLGLPGQLRGAGTRECLDIVAIELKKELL